MKKFVYLFSFLFICIIVCGCSIPVSVEVEKDVNLYVGDEYELTLKLENISEEDLVFTSLNTKVIECTGKKLFAVGAGEAIITISSEKVKDFEEININVKVNKKPVLVVNKEIDSLVEGKTLQIEYTVTDYEGLVTFESEFPEIVQVNQNGLVTALKPGNSNITISCGPVKEVINIVVVEAKDFSITGDKVCTIQDTIQLDILCEESIENLVWASSNETIAIVDQNGNVKGLQEGTVTISADYYGIIAAYDISIIKDDVAPTIEMQGSSDVVINWGEDFNILSGVTASDNIDKDITDKIKVSPEFNNKKYGEQVINLSVTDSSGNEITLTRKITIQWNYGVQFIGHAGSYYGLMNSEEAFIYAASVLGYQMIECDLKQSSDGVFIMCHDDTFAGVALASTPWSKLKTLEATGTRNAGYPSENGSVTNGTYTAKLCTLERYLEICKEYGVTAVIELKSSKGITNSDQSRMSALMSVIKKCGMLNNVVFLASQYNCLIWTRNNGYDYIPCQYLVYSCENETFLQRCIDNKLDLSINVTGGYNNSEEWLARYKEYDIKISTYTYSQYTNYDVVQEWIDKGVDYLTCDWHVMSELNLPPVEDANVTKHNVTFKDFDGTVLKETQVKEGKTAASPKEPSRKGYVFTGWDKSLKNITSDTVFTAQYEIETYTITYNSNLFEIKEAKWANKTEFVTEFYNDLYSWFISNGDKVNGLTNNNGEFTLSKNNVTVTFKNATDILAIDIYDFEKTISNVIYKPVTRNNDGSCIIFEDEAYFLNSSEYLEKYRDMDKYFYNACVNGYSSYDRTYTPTSSGKIQIMFRFHQWSKGTNIACFNTLPKKYEVKVVEGVNVQIPTSPVIYTILDNIVLPNASSDLEFLGWTTTANGTDYISEIKAGSTGNVILYAQWKK